MNHSANVILFTGLYMLIVTMLGLPSHWEGICWLKPSQAHCSLQTLIYLLSNFYILCWTEPHIHCSPVTLVWLAQEDVILC